MALETVLSPCTAFNSGVQDQFFRVS